MIEEGTEDVLVIGYYPIRAKAQVCRLLCQYLGLKYRDQFFSQDQWDHYQKDQAKNWIVKDLPFLKDGNFIVTQPAAMGFYIVQKANRLDLLGVTLDDKITIDKFRTRKDLKDALMAMHCHNSKCPEEKKICKYQMWQNVIEPQLKEYENRCRQNQWYLSSLSVLDFVFYEMINTIEKNFPNEIKNFPKILALRAKVSQIQQIRDYQISERAVKNSCPVQYFKEFKQHLTSSNISTNNSQMSSE